MTVDLLAEHDSQAFIWRGDAENTNNEQTQKYNTVRYKHADADIKMVKCRHMLFHSQIRVCIYIVCCCRRRCVCVVVVCQ